jgi:hypothetical protein
MTLAIYYRIPTDPSRTRRIDRRAAASSERSDPHGLRQFRSFLDGTDLCSRGLNQRRGSLRGRP